MRRARRAHSGFCRDHISCPPMPGFSAPKLLWLARPRAGGHPAHAKILLPKDFVRLCLSGDAVTDLADGSATLMMNTRAGTWGATLASACGISTGAVAAAPSRVVRSAARCGRRACRSAGSCGSGLPIAGGAGDDIDGAVGAGVIKRGDACISLGTSGVYFVANDTFVPAHDEGMHTHRHAIEGSVCTAWLRAERCGGAFVAHGSTQTRVRRTVPRRHRERRSRGRRDPGVHPPVSRGERTPHDDPTASATFSNLRIGHGTRCSSADPLLEGSRVCALPRLTGRSRSTPARRSNGLC